MREIDGLSLGASFYAPALQLFLNGLRSNPAATNPLRTYVDVNPKVDVSDIDAEATVSFIPMQSVSDGATGEYVSTDRQLGEVSKGYTCFADGDILWAKITPCMQNGKSCTVDGLKNGVGFGSTEFHVLRVRDDEISPQFVFEFVNQETLRQVATFAFTGSAGQQRVQATFLENLPFPKLSVTHQNHLISRMDEARAERKAKIAEADALLAGVDDFVLDALGVPPPPEDSRRVFATRGQVNSGRFDPHYHLPRFAGIEDALSRIQCERLGDIVAFSKETWKPQDHRQSVFRYIEISTVSPQTGEASWNEVPTEEAPSRARMKVRTDDIIVSLTRPHHGSIAHLGPDFDGCIASTGFAVIRSVATRLHREYLWSVLRSRRFVSRRCSSEPAAVTIRLY